MAVDYNELNLLLWAKKLGASFERTVTLGRQGLVCSPARLKGAVRAFGLPVRPAELERCFERPPMGGLYAEGLLRMLGAQEIVSVDYSDFEGATLLHDLNQPFPAEMQGRFTFVFDGGTLEHIFNYPAALRHALELVGLRGHFLTTTPAHGLMGHGFFQISPELMFRVLAPENGFALCKLVLYGWGRADAFYEVKDPAVTGFRTDLTIAEKLNLGALAQRTEIKPVLARPPMQSDYAAHWAQHQKLQPGSAGAHPAFLGRLRRALNPHVPYWLFSLLRTWRTRTRAAGPASLSNPTHFRRLSLEEIHREGSSGPEAGLRSPKVP